METPPRRPYVSPPPHPTNTTRPLPPLVRCLFYTLRPPPRAPLSRVHQELVSIRRRVRGPTYSTGSVTDNGIVSPFLSLPPSLSLPPPFCLSFSFSLDFSPRSFFPRPFRLLRVASLCSLRPRRPYFGSEECSSRTPFRRPPLPPRVIRNRALLDLAGLCLPPRLLHAFHLAIFAKDERRVE